MIMVLVKLTGEVRKFRAKTGVSQHSEFGRQSVAWPWLCQMFHLQCINKHHPRQARQRPRTGHRHGSPRAVG